jgi:hypothetical protein
MHFCIQDYQIVEMVPMVFERREVRAMLQRCLPDRNVTAERTEIAWCLSHVTHEPLFFCKDSFRNLMGQMIMRFGGASIMALDQQQAVIFGTTFYTFTLVVSGTVDEGGVPVDFTGALVWDTGIYLPPVNGVIYYFYDCESRDFWYTAMHYKLYTVQNIRK